MYDILFYFYNRLCITFVASDKNLYVSLFGEYKFNTHNVEKYLSIKVIFSVFVITCMIINDLTVSTVRNNPSHKTIISEFNLINLFKGGDIINKDDRWCELERIVVDE